MPPPLAPAAHTPPQRLAPSRFLPLLQEQAFPRVQRDILQVEQYSQKLRGKAARGDATAETLEASRLLAHEGLNPRRLTQALQTFELRPTYEDVFAVETATVDEYLQQVRGFWVLGAGAEQQPAVEAVGRRRRPAVGRPHQARLLLPPSSPARPPRSKQVFQMIGVTAVQEAQQSAVAAFEGFMDASMDAEWQQEKAALFDAVAPYSAASALTPGPSPGGALSPYNTRGGGTPGGPVPAYRGTPGLSPLGAGPLTAGNLALRGRAAKYADAVRKLNAATAGGDGGDGGAAFNAVAEFQAACADESNGGLGCGLWELWQLGGRHVWPVPVDRPPTASVPTFQSALPP